MKLGLPKEAIKEIKAILNKYRLKYYNPRIVAEVLSRSERAETSDRKPIDLSKFLDIKVKPCELVKEQRKRIGLTLAELSRLTGIAISNLSAIESGKRPIGVAIAKKMARALKINYRVLI